MSRIAGLIHSKPCPELLHNALLVAAKGSDQTKPWRQQRTQIASLQLGWTGWQYESRVEKNNIVVLLDGFIYNEEEFDEPSSVSKLEFLIDLYLKEDFANMLNRLNGDFIIVLFDKNKNELFIGRDRFGIKPLYYAKKSNYFCFASRCASLLALGIEAEPNPSFIGRFAGSHYRYIDNCPTESPYLHIHQLPAAHYLRLRIHSSSPIFELLEIKRWWDLTERPEFDMKNVNEEELAEQYRDLLLDAVKRRLKKAEQPIFTLSGGMDSSSVLASAVHNTGTKFHAVSTVYKDKTYDESNEIQSMLEQTVSEWHSVYIDNPDVFDLISRMVSLHDEPVATATWLSHFILCQSVSKQGFHSLFGGLGGDELNAGEYEYFFFHFADLMRNGNKTTFNHEVQKWCEYHDHPIFKKTPEIARVSLERMVDFSKSGHCLPDKSRMLRYAEVMNPDFFNESFQPTLEHRFASYLKNRTYQDLFFETAPCCLRAEDRQATAYNLDNFLPFFDYRLAEFMFRIPGSLKIRDGVTKVLLRQAMKNILPEETRTRIKKTGWNAPAHQWFSGHGLSQVKDLVNSKKFRERGIFNEVQLERILNEHETIVRNQNAKENHMMFLWQVINLELWLRSIETSKSVSYEY